MSRDTRLGQSMIGVAARGNAMRPVGNGLVCLLCIILAGPAMGNTVTVNTLEGLNPSTADGLCSLREAVKEVITPNSQTGECQASDPNGVDTITFTVTGTIILSGPPSPAPRPIDDIDNIDEGLIISGPGARLLTINGANSFRVFTISGGEAVTIEGLTIANGRNPDGGGIRNSGTLTIRNATIRGNLANDDGGGIDNGNTGTLTVENSTFTGNSADHEGGGVVNFGNATFVNTTFSGNEAGRNPPPLITTEDGGGAIFNSGGTVTLINCTIAGNTNVGGTQMGDGIFMEDDGLDIAVTTLQNTLVAANDDDNCMLTGQNLSIDDRGGNLDDGATCGFTDSTSMTNVPAGLAAGLQDNGGPTDTIALSPGSAAIDEVVNCAAAGSLGNRDQRGAPRPIDGNGDGNAFCDIGAFESGSVPPQPNQLPVVTNPGNQTGVVGENVTLAISASDLDGDTLSFIGTGLPVGLSINPNTGFVTGTLSTAGTSNVSVTVNDGRGGTASASFTWTVTSTSAGGPVPRCSGRPATVFVDSVSGLIVGGRDAGLLYNGRLRGTTGDDVMVGTTSRDILVGSGGNDRICGGGGPDDIKGGAGNDRLFGERGRDRLSGGGGSDRCDGGPGRDTITTTCERILNP